MQIDQALRQIIRSLYLTNSALFLHLGQPDRDKLSVGSIGELKVRVATRSNETVSLNETCWFDVANVAEFSGFARSMDSSYDRFYIVDFTGGRPGGTLRKELDETIAGVASIYLALELLELGDQNQECDSVPVAGSFKATINSIVMLCSSNNKVKFATGYNNTTFEFVEPSECPPLGLIHDEDNPTRSCSMSHLVFLPDYYATIRYQRIHEAAIHAGRPNMIRPNIDTDSILRRTGSTDGTKRLFEVRDDDDALRGPSSADPSASTEGSRTYPMNWDRLVYVGLETGIETLLVLGHLYVELKFAFEKRRWGLQLTLACFYSQSILKLVLALGWLAPTGSVTCYGSILLSILLYISFQLDQLDGLFGWLWRLFGCSVTLALAGWQTFQAATDRTHPFAKYCAIEFSAELLKPMLLLLVICTSASLFCACRHESGITTSRFAKLFVSKLIGRILTILSQLSTTDKTVVASPIHSWPQSLLVWSVLVGKMVLARWENSREESKEHLIRRVLAKATFTRRAASSTRDGLAMGFPQASLKLTSS